VTLAAQAESARPRPLRSLLSALLVFLVLVLATAALKGWRDLERARGREAELRARVEATRESIETLRRRVRALKDDPATLERVARDELGMVKPDDVVIVLPAPPPGRPAPAVPAPDER
jgi:cell division protein FtsB